MSFGAGVREPGPEWLRAQGWQGVESQAWSRGEHLPLGAASPPGWGLERAGRGCELWGPRKEGGVVGWVTVLSAVFAVFPRGCTLDGRLVPKVVGQKQTVYLTSEPHSPGPWNASSGLLGLQWVWMKGKMLKGCLDFLSFQVKDVLFKGLYFRYTSYSNKYDWKIINLFILELLF